MIFGDTDIFRKELLNHEEAQKGTIAKGKYADFVILDRNPLETADDQLADIQVLRTIKENRNVYQKS